MKQIKDGRYKLKAPIHTDANVRLVRGRSYDLIQRNWDCVDVYDDKVYYGALCMTDAIDNFNNLTIC